jgi:hypothetical protein
MKRLIWFLLIGSAFGQLYPYAPPSPTSGGGGGIAFRQACTIQNKTSAVTTVTVPCGTSVAGDMIIIPIIESGAAVTGTTCSDGVNTYVTAVGSVSSEGFCYALNVAGGTVSVVVTFGTSTSFAIVGGLEFSDVALTSAIDGSSTNNQLNGASTSLSGPATATLSATNELVIYFGGSSSTNATYTATSAGLTIPGTNGQVSGGNQSGFMAYAIPSATTAYTPTATVSTSIATDTYTVAFKHQ